MTITVEKITEIDDDIFDSLYADCVDDLGAGSFPFPDGLDAAGKKTHIKNGYNNFSDILLFEKDDTPVMLMGGYIKDLAFYVYDYNNPPENSNGPTGAEEKKSFTDLYHWKHCIVGEHDGSKNWCRTSEFYNAWKTYLLSINAKGYVIVAEKGKPADVHFKQAQTDGIPLGTYTLNQGEFQSTMIWVY